MHRVKLKLIMVKQIILTLDEKTLPTKYQQSLRQTVPLPSAWVFAERYLSGARQRPPLPSAGLSAKNALGNDSFA
jgi:hypothetical protein